MKVRHLSERVINLLELANLCKDATNMETSSISFIFMQQKLPQTKDSNIFFMLKKSILIQILF